MVDRGRSSDEEGIEDTGLETVMVSDTARQKHNVSQGKSMQHPNTYYRDNRSRRPLEIENRTWLSASGITARKIKSRARQESPPAAPARSGVKIVDQALVFDARQIIRHAGISLDGSILEFDTGTRPIGVCYPDYVAVDNDPKNVMLLRRMGIKAVRGTIEGLPIPKKSFDYVLAFSPLLIRNSDDWHWIDKGTNGVELHSDYKKIIVKRAIEIARRKVLIASRPIAVDPPFAENAELIVTDSRNHFYYVVYAVD